MRTVIIFAILALCLLGIRCGFAQNIKTVRAEGMGMSPTVKNGDKLIIDLEFYERSNDVQRFDIIALRLSGMSDDLFHYKRVIGLPSEKLEIRSGRIFVNNSLLEEPFDKQTWEENDF